MSTENFNDVVITGNQDTTQLQVKGNVTQTEPLETWEDSGGDVLARVTDDGRMQVGDDVGLASPDALIEAHRHEDSTTKPKRGIHSLGRISGILNSVVHWMVAELELLGSDVISTVHSGLRVKASNLNSGTPTSGAELRAGDFEVANNAEVGTPALPTAVGLQVSVTNATGNTITDAVALKLKINNEGTITNPYVIFAEGEGSVHLEDYIELISHEEILGTPPTNFLWIYPKSDGKLYAKNWDGTEFDLTGGGGGAVSSVNTQTGAVVLGSDDIAEGVSNLYYTDARTDGRINTQKGAANGLATLGSDSKIPSSQLPAIAITDVFVVSSQAAMLALPAERGDVAVRTDINKSFILINETPSILSNWQEILAPGISTVLSVNTQTGAVVLDSDDVAEGTTNQYYTDERVDDRVATLMTPGSNIDLAYNDVANTLTISVTGLSASDIGALSEAIDDRVSSLLIAGSNIGLSYNDGANTLTISVTGLTSAQISDFTEAAQDAAGSLITAGTNISVSYNDAGNALTIAFSGTLPIANGGTGQTTKTDAFDALAPSTTKGDIIVHNGSDNVRVPVGSDGQVWSANSSATSGGSWINVNVSDLEFFGNGKDGDATVSTSITLTRDMYYHNLTIQSGAVINPAGYRIFVSGTLDITAAPAGWLTRAGKSNPGTGLPSANIGGSGGGGNGSTGAGGAQVGGAGTAADMGGAGGRGGRAGDLATRAVAGASGGEIIDRLTVDLILGNTIPTGGAGGSGGTAASGTGNGGSAGGGGGVIWIAAHTVNRDSVTSAAGGITVRGGNGLNGSAGTNGGGGGGGGGGGVVYFIYRYLLGTTAATQIQANGGTGGAGGNGTASGGSSGDSGVGGQIYVIDLSAQTMTNTNGGQTLSHAPSGATGGAASTAPNCVANV